MRTTRVAKLLDEGRTPLALAMASLAVGVTGFVATLPNPFTQGGSLAPMPPLPDALQELPISVMAPHDTHIFETEGTVEAAAPELAPTSEPAAAPATTRPATTFVRATGGGGSAVAAAPPAPPPAAVSTPAPEPAPAPDPDNHAPTTAASSPGMDLSGDRFDGRARNFEPVVPEATETPAPAEPTPTSSGGRFHTGD